MNIINVLHTAVDPVSSGLLTAAPMPLAIVLNDLVPVGLGIILANLLGAVAILFVGWLVALLVSSTVQKLLNQTELDNRLSRTLTGSSDRKFWVP
jgi:hypothetical protein